MKKIIRKLHLWLGFASGLVLILVCLSGALIAFTEEALDIANRKYLHVPRQNLPKAPVETVIANYSARYPQEKLFLINVYQEENRSYDFFSAVKTGKKDAEGNEEFGGYKMVYADPYTGEILRVDKGTLEAIILLVTLHVNLFLGEAGAYIIQVATLIFLLQIIGGLYLWWPSTKNALKTVFRIKTNGSIKRLNYDLHRTLGFYASFILLILVLTGLVMAWDFIKYPVTDLFGGKSALLVHEHPPQPQLQPNAKDYSYNQLFYKLLQERPETQQVTFYIPGSDTISIIGGRTNSRTTFLNFEVGRYFQFNRYDGSVAGGDEMKYYDRNNEIMAATLLIHMGFWGGLPTKILTFFAGLIGASLPITGFLIWRKRGNKKAGSLKRVSSQ